MKRLAFAFILFPVAILAQQRDVRPTPAPTAVATGEISGVVMTADSQPLRRVVVSVSGDALVNLRSAITDDAGRFTFPRLPAGTYAVSAKKAAYLPAEFGTTRPGQTGSRLAIAVGEKRSISLKMFRGAAVAGILSDANGAPINGVEVTALNVRTFDKRGAFQADPVTTNDHGEYRIYGLPPGEYMVVATPYSGGSGEIGARPTAEVDALLASIATRQNRPVAPSLAAQPAPLPPSVGYSATYYPGTPLFNEGTRIRLEPGDVRDNLSFVITHVPVASIEGTISNMANLTTPPTVAIVPQVMDFLEIGAGPSGIPYTGQQPDAQGVFKYGNLPPGPYRIVARGTEGSGYMYAVADLDVRGQDIKGLNLVLQPGGTVSGMLVFDSGGAPIPADVSRVRVGLSMTGRNSYWQMGNVRIGNMLADVPLAQISPTSTFQLVGIGPARYEFTCTLPPDLAPVWKVRSAMYDGRDLLDEVIVGPNVRLEGVAITVSDKRTEISGTLLSGTGQPTAGYFVVAFPADRALWRAGSRRNMSARPATNGRYTFSDPPAGEYFIAALTDLDQADWQDPAFFEQIAPAAIKIRIGEGEKKVQDLRIR